MEGDDLRKDTWCASLEWGVAGVYQRIGYRRMGYRRTGYQGMGYQKVLENRVPEDGAPEDGAPENGVPENGLPCCYLRTGSGGRAAGRDRAR